MAGVVAYALYNLIGLFTNIFFYHRFAVDFTSARLNHLGLWVIVTPVIGGLIVGVMAEVWIVQDQGPWHSGSDGGGARKSKPHPAQGRDPETDLCGHRNRHWRSVRRGRAHHPDRRSPRIAGRTSDSHHRVGTKVLLACGAAAGMSATFNTPIAGVILGHRALAVRIQISFVYPAGDCEHARYGRALSIARPRPDV